ncbi:MAG TPA: AsmA family protein [Caulobacterales bacterium]|nr:AsmA family protein [Caulobacterales bacterium]
MSIRRTLLIGFGAVVGVIVAAIAALFAFFPKDAALAEATRHIDAATGRHLVVRGPVSFTLFPALGVSVRQASLSNPPGFGEAPFLSADRLVLAVAVLPLLRGDIQVKRLILDGAELNLVAKADGQANWTFPTEETAPQQQSTIEDLHLDDMRLTHARITFQGADGAPASVLENVNAGVKLASLDQPAQMHAELDYRGERVSIDAELGLPRAVLEQRQTPLSARVASAPLNASLDGAFNARSGVLGGTLDASGASVRRLMAWIGSPMAEGGGFGPFRLHATMVHEDTKTTLHQSTIKLDAIEARGDLDLVTDAHGRVSVTGALSSPLLDLNPYLPAPAQGAAQGGAGGVDTAAAWSAAPLDLSGLKAMDAQLTLQAEALKFQRMSFQNVAMNLRILRGVADARLTRIALYGGVGAARLVADGASLTPRIAVELNADNVQALPLLSDAIGFDKIEGRGHVQASLGGAGRSQAAIMRALGGTASFTFNDGAWRGVNLAQVARTVQAALTGTRPAAGSQSTDFAEMGAHFTLANGIAATQDLRLLNPFVRLEGTGVVDVGAQSLDMRIAPRAVRSAQGQGGDAALQGLGIPFRVHGPWSRVSFEPDLGNTLQAELRNRTQGVLSSRQDNPLAAILGASQDSAPTATTTAAPAQAQPQQQQQQQQQRTPEQQTRDALENLLNHHK